MNHPVCDCCGNPVSQERASAHYTPSFTYPVSAVDVEKDSYASVSFKVTEGADLCRDCIKQLLVRSITFLATQAAEINFPIPNVIHDYVSELGVKGAWLPSQSEPARTPAENAS